MIAMKRQMMLLAAMLLLLVIAAAWSTQLMLDQRNRARLAMEDAAACRELGESIESLRTRPRIASAQDIGLEVLGRRIAAATQQAGLDRQSLEGVYPQSERRLGNSSYVLKPTTLALRDVTLAKLVTFLAALTDGESSLNVRDLRLRAPRGESDSRLWDAEATITCLIYQPPVKERPQP